MNYLRSEYPRPQFERENWQNLNGTWDFRFDDDDKGLRERWYMPDSPFPMQINVPFVYECELSGINTREQHDIIWYKRNFDAPSLTPQQHLLLHFGAVDYQTQVFLNGQMVKEHTGGETPFSVDITPFLTEGTTQNLCLRVYDPLTNQEIPRGKQFWKSTPKGIWYTRSSGIWQTVWTEVVNEQRIESLAIKPDLDSGSVEFTVHTKTSSSNTWLKVQIHYQDKLFVETQIKCVGPTLKFSVDIFGSDIFRTGFHGADEYIWSPEYPNLFTVELTLSDINSNLELDSVSSYFGMRKIHTENGIIYLNNKPYYQKLVLDQGYWPRSLLTAPTDDDYRLDISLAKEMGFNGCRKHQKLEDPRFLYWADQLGFLVWEECSSTPLFTTESQIAIFDSWKAVYQRDRNHPCIVAWVPLNESWGVPQIHSNQRQQHWAQALYHLLRSLDDTRLVSSNDGWDQTITDICAIHNYKLGKDADDSEFTQFCETLTSKEALVSQFVSGHPVYAAGFGYRGEPILITECGGIGFANNQNSDWSYLGVSSAAEFLATYRRLISTLRSSQYVQGFCYTQLTDVEQEVNGLLTYERTPKFDLKELRQINAINDLPSQNLT
ncbi:glycoside hydrolase family 2 protein [Mobiluncus curtisii]|uniref:Glycosyl hydrolase family 2, sugar binding domain protein n=2 Tax=Mobiluncus curtisii TaxID=2051 RepID=D6ZIL2_MOBCV|nr:glycoside hydrolase family 2 [Mobiluncus curtisii]ADI66561.1 glycosyl hydrolase family 2, sugar binding domain protein [Mobiluncus curtisii ATCC 43063]NMW44940.1 glycoside hydrolase family 2 [Mobiluncus curtisii]QQU07937.1 glycoside hydrolase family 2 [Mobiluncus curtisii]SQB64112.1 Beta-glucuronidase [Mobiluncus curtisii]